MKTAKTIIILIVAIFIGSAILLLSIKYEPEQKSNRRMIAEEEMEIEWQWYKLTANKVFYAAMPTILGVSTLLFSGLFGLSLVRKQSIYFARIGKHSEIPVHLKDLRDFYPIAVNLSLAEIEASVSNAHEKAFKISERILESIAICSKPFKSHSGLVSQTALPVSLPAVSQAIPTFRELLSQGIISPSKPLVFGITQTGQIKTGDWSDLFSSAIAGQSQQGKTSTLRSIIAQSLLTNQVETFWIFDYHYPHPKSLLATLGELKQLHHIKYVENKIETVNLMKEAEFCLDQRLQGKETSETVKVVVMDETLILVGNIPEAKRLVLRIGTEGAKARMYGLFSAQSWVAENVGGTITRDNLTSAIIHRMKPRQAQTLLQDSDQVKICKRLEKGQALFIPTNNKEEIINIPFCTSSDMQDVFQMISKNGSQNAQEPLRAIETRNAGETTQKRDETEETVFLEDVNKLRETVVSWIETKQETYSGLETKLATREKPLNKSQIYRFCKGENPSETLHVALSKYYQNN